jgi:subtilisin family serine protease
LCRLIMALAAGRLHSGIILAFVAIVSLGLPRFAGAAPADRDARVPHDAFTKNVRPDLIQALREGGEVRVIVGLQNALEIAELAPQVPDQLKEEHVNAKQARVLKRLARHYLRDIKRLRHHPFMALTVDAAALSALLADPEVTSVAEDRPVYPTLNDTPGITRADRAWAEGYAGTGQTVAVVDTGVDQSHPFLSGKIVAEACFATPRSGTTSYCPGGVASFVGAGSGRPCSESDLGCWHGTHVAGIATGRYGLLSATTGGIGHDSNIIAIQVFQRFCDSSGCRIVAYDSDILRALDHVYSLRTTFNIASVNLSLGGDLYTATCDASLPSYRSVVASLRAANIATVVAAGNNGNAGAISAPGCLSNVISVGSTTKSNTISSFSNSASFLSLLAPGSLIVSSVTGGSFGTASGTSMATPHVAGAWAVLKSAKANATVDDVLVALQSKGLPITDPRNGVVKSLIQIGASTESGALSTVLGNRPPTVNLTSPANNTTVTAPASVSLSATAVDPDGAVSKVEFYRDATVIATVTTPTSGSYTFTDANVAAGTYTYLAKAYDNASPAAVATSAASLVTVNAPGTVAVNVAAQANGGVASASTSYNVGYAASSANNGDRKGLNWGNGGGWNDATANTFGDWLQVTFNGTYSISEIDIFTVQDNFAAPVDPTPTMTFTQWGSTAYQVQYWNGSAWLDVPGGNIVGNNLVWRRITFSPVSTNAIRIIVNNGLNSYARITEIEAWTNMTGPPPPTNSTNVAAQANGGVASASTTYTATGTNYLPSGANNGDRRGLNWGNSGGWNDATSNSFGDWLQVTFNNAYTIGRIDVFTVQDNYAAPSEPTPSMTFTQWGITEFQVQYLSGGVWVNVPGGNIAGNNLVWRGLTFSPVTTTAIRVVVNGALNAYSRVTEIEAWTQ